METSLFGSLITEGLISYMGTCRKSHDFLPVCYILLTMHYSIHPKRVPKPRPHAGGGDYSMV